MARHSSVNVMGSERHSVARIEVILGDLKSVRYAKCRLNTARLELMRHVSLVRRVAEP